MSSLSLSVHFIWRASPTWWACLLLYGSVQQLSLIQRLSWGPSNAGREPCSTFLNHLAYFYPNNPVLHLNYFPIWIFLFILYFFFFVLLGFFDIAILISDKRDFELKLMTRDREEHYILTNGKIHQWNITILNIYAPNMRVFVVQSFL